MGFSNLGFRAKELQGQNPRLFKALAILSVFVVSGCTFEPLAPPAQTGAISNKHTRNQIADNTTSATNSESSKENEEEPRASLESKLLKQSISEPLTPENTNQLLNEVGSNWLYGQGMGETAATVGTIVIFPPYALWVIGNAALQLSGEEPIEVSKMLPEESGKVWRTTYDEITSVPGRTTAAVSGEEYRTQEVARDHIEAVLDKNAEDVKKQKQLEQKQKSRLAIVESR